MKRLIVGLFMLTTSCASWTPQQQSTAADVTQIAIDIACLLGSSELSDAELKVVCKGNRVGPMSDEEFNRYSSALATHRTKLYEARTVKSDAGCLQY